MQRRKPIDPSLTQVLSLYILLLAFFVLLFNISKVERFRADTVSESLNSAFASSGRITGMPHALSSDDGQLLELRAFAREVGRLVRHAVPAVRYEVDYEGRLMEAQFPVAELFASDEVALTDAAQDLVEDLADAFGRLPTGLRFGIEAIIIVPGVLIPGSGGPDVATPMARAAIFAAAFDEFETTRGDLAAGIRNGPSPVVRLTFHVRPQREAKLGLGSGGGSAPGEGVRQ